MGKIVAIGGGRYDNGEIINIFEKIVSLADKESPKVLFIPTAGYDDINGDEHIQYGFEKFGCQYDILYLTDEKRTVDDIRSVILGADIIYVGGGDVRFMMETWRKTGADKALTEAYHSGKIMSGYSAGAVCWFDVAYDDCGTTTASCSAIVSEFSLIVPVRTTNPTIGRPLKKLFSPDPNRDLRSKTVRLCFSLTA